MTAFFAAFATAYVSLVLLCSAVDHMLRWRRFGTAVYAHRMLPGAAVAPICAAIAAAELLLGVATLLSMPPLGLVVSPAMCFAGVALLTMFFVTAYIVLLTTPVWLAAILDDVEDHADELGEPAGTSPED